MTAAGDPFEGVRPLLFSIAYRMTGTRADAEDVLQDAFLRWQAADHAAIESPKAFLTTVVSRLSLDVLKAARRKRELYAGPWLPEAIVGPVNEPVELAESLSLAFLHVLESLPAEERVAFLMREVFDAAYSEVSETLETS
jgi:RNA polymerase sigma-70 factor, ECF subfamily